MRKIQTYRGGRKEKTNVMSQYVREWVMSVVLLVAAAAFFEGIFPAGSMNRYLKYIFALVILSAVLAPVKLFFY